MYIICIYYIHIHISIIWANPVSAPSIFSFSSWQRVPTGADDNRKTPGSSWENRWFPVKIFPRKPIH